MEKNWIIAERKSGNLLAQLLLNRGIEKAVEQQEFLDPPSPDSLISRNPHLFGISPGKVEQAAGVIRKAINEGQPIIIHGDYDVDGLCSTAILWETLYFGLGYKNVHPFIPDRFTDGYGLSTKSLEKINQQYSNVTMKPLLITVDCGITAAKEVANARQLGMVVIVVDHHSCPGILPNAQGIVWSDKVCATALAWLLGCQLLPEMGKSRLDLVVLATLADLQPLLGVNRSLAKHGLEVLNHTPHLGLKVLLEEVGLLDKRINTYEAGWIISPRLNAAGRLESALDSLRLLCTRDRAQAQKIAAQLNKLNAERQRMTVEMVDHAKESYLTIEQSGNEARRIILVHHESYHEGVIGLVAGRLAQEFNRPTLVLSQGETLSKGSARSVPGFDITAALRKLDYLFEDLGGHPMAAGFTIKNEKIANLEGALLSLADKELAKEALSPPLLIDAQLSLAQINLELLETLKKLEPHGIGNPQPLFLSSGVKMAAVQAVGAEGKHLKLRLADSGKEYSAIWFGQGGLVSSFTSGSVVDVVYSLAEDTWNGSSRLSLHIKDMRVVE